MKKNLKAKKTKKLSSKRFDKLELETALNEGFADRKTDLLRKK